MHEKILKLDQLLLKDHAADIELFQKLTEAQRNLGLLQGERPTCPFLRPHFISRRQYQEIINAAEILASAFENLTIFALQNREAIIELGLSAREEDLARIDPRYKGICHSSRLDTFIFGDEFKFLEYNGENPAGIGDQLQLEKVLEHIPGVKDFLDTNEHWRPKPHKSLLEALLKSYREMGGKKEKPSIAIVDWSDVATGSEFMILKEYFAGEGYPCEIFDPHELEYDGSRLHVKDFGIDIFYKRVIIHEFIDRFDDNHPLINAYRDGNILMANSFRSKIPHKKASFALLSDERYSRIFDSRQLEIIRKHIPWTRRIRERKTTYNGEMIDLLEYLRKNREKFTIKPNDDYGGKGIFLGWECSESEWETGIENGLKSEFIAQERVKIEKIPFPVYDIEKAGMQQLLVDFDPFLFLGKAEGGLVRLSSSSLVNVTQGGGQSALIILE